MIERLFDLKQKQINQQILQKQQLLAKVEDIDKQLLDTNHSLTKASVDIMGAISDFRVLQIHKNTMKETIIKLGEQKMSYLREIEKYDRAIIELNKESEQFNYIIEEQKREKVKRVQRQEEFVASEYAQVKYINNRTFR